MADGRLVQAHRVISAANAAWVRMIAFLGPRCRRAVAAARSGWVRMIAFLGPRCRRAVAAARSGWVQAIAFLAARGRQALAAARTARDRRSGGSIQRDEPRGGTHQASRPAALRSRVSQLAKQWSADDNEGEYVGLADLLEKDERDRQYQ